MSSVTIRPTGDMSAEEAMLSGDGFTALMGRLAVSDFVPRLSAFIQSEKDRGTHPLDILAALASFQIQMHAGLAANVLKQDGLELAALIYAKRVSEIYLPHALMTHGELAKRRRGS